MATYKTPGVYVEEISNMPKSVNWEKTSVALFIGYTEKVADANGNDLKQTPVNIRSLLEYETIFGNTAGNKFLYDSIKLFYANGGNECFIMSVGNIDEPASLSNLQDGLSNSNGLAVQLIAIPDACLLTAQDFSLFQQKVLRLCGQKKDRFAILDTLSPTNDFDDDIQLFRAGIGIDNLQWGAVYYPWLVIENNKWVPPSGAIAGIYCQVDKDRGVWKAPANMTVKGILEIAAHINDKHQGVMNIDTVSGKSMNAIRFFTGRGFLVWGARTLAGNDNEWRYIPVRRLFITVEQSIQNSTGWVVFEPNDANTWVKIKAEIENFLTTLWRNGALAGSKPGEAFYVNVGLNKTMTAADILQGNMIVEVGLAPIRSAEFILLRFSYKMISA